MSYHTKDTRLVPGKGHSIVEKDEGGNIIGAYTGYWYPSSRSITLYPDYRHPAVKPGTKLNKRKIYDGYVKCARAAAVSPDKAKSAVKSQTSAAIKDIIGQERIKF